MQELRVRFKNGADGLSASVNVASSGLGLAVPKPLRLILGAPAAFRASFLGDQICIVHCVCSLRTIHDVECFENGGDVRLDGFLGYA